MKEGEMIKMKMKTIRVENLASAPVVKVTETDKPGPVGPDEVLVRVLCIGLDGTDREILVEHYGTPPAGDTGLTTGHESLGVVEEAGAESGLQPGDLVTALVRRPCNDADCVNCRNGHADFCETGEYVERGIKGAHGYLAEYYKESGRYVVKVPRDCLPYGMLAEPQSIVEKVWDQVQKVQQRLIWEPKTAVVLGSGPLGLLAAMTCRVLGLETHVWSMSAEDSVQAKLARGCGAVYHQAGGAGKAGPNAVKNDAGAGPGIVDKDGAGAGPGITDKDGSNAASAKAGKPATLTEFAERLGKRIDLIFECTGYSPLAFEAMGVLGPNGVLALLGVTPGKRKQEVPTDALNFEMVLENKCVLGSVNASRKDFETGLYRLQQMHDRFPDMLTGIITERIRLEDVPQLDFKRIVVKAVVDVVPAEQWESLVKQTRDAAYSFSV
jgi:threonine dehydrogenase-like Zn-dependent dehydrogenase